MGPMPVQPVVSDHGSWLVPVLIMVTIGWFLLQLRPERKRIWARRWAPVEPVAVIVVTDVLATWNYLRTFKPRQIVSLQFWRERLQFKRIWRDYRDY